MRKIGRVWSAAGAAVFERRIARVLGMDRALARELLVEARVRNGRRPALRCAAFVVATTRVSPHLVPRAVRERAIRSFVAWLLEGQEWNSHLPIAYAGRPGLAASETRPGLARS